MRLKQKIAIITGAANGIGKTTAKLFANEGAHVILWDVSEEVENVAFDITRNGLSAEFKILSVVDRKKVRNSIGSIIQEHKKIDILINNAGITRDRTLLKMSEQEWSDVIDINLTGVFNCTQGVAEIMKTQQYGKIISAASNVGIRGNYGQTNYVATKAGVIGMTKVWALELGKYGINVNCIAPGFIQTAMTDEIPDEIKKKIIAEIPMMRIGKTEDISNGYLYLASDESSYVNGICLTIDGGITR